MLYLFVVGRILLGVYFLISGYNHFKNLKMLTGYADSKGVPMPATSVVLTGLMMVLGGAGVLLGIYTQISILLLVVFLIITTFMMHQFWTVADPMQKMGEEINFKKNLALVGALLCMLAIPSFVWMQVALF
ncbi:DoxX family protein [Candidatus Nomurabacteria bacterium]|nr:DoxX family protein [Candidatus Nomurabacteria bacterium]